MAWTQQHYPAGGPESQLLATLEKCTNTLLPLERYKNDVRYLRAWVQRVRVAAVMSHAPRSRAAIHAQADCCNEPKDIFDYMEVCAGLKAAAGTLIGAHAPRLRRSQLKGIGQDYALFYEARAAFLELRGAFPQALNVYLSGIKRCVPFQLCAWMPSELVAAWAGKRSRCSG